MRAARLTETAQQRFFRRFDENQIRRPPRGVSACKFRQTFELLAFASINQQRRRVRFPRRLHAQFTEGGNQINGQVIDAIVAEIFEGFEDGTFSRAAQTGEDHQLQAVRERRVRFT